MTRLPTIYFVQAELGGPVKIGYTGRHARARMAEGQTFVPQELILLAEAYGTEADEDKLHKLFEQYKVRGEWFQYVGLVRDLVQYLDEGGNLQLWLEGI